MYLYISRKLLYVFLCQRNILNMNNKKRPIIFEKKKSTSFRSWSSKLSTIACLHDRYQYMSIQYIYWRRHWFCHDDVIKWKHFPRYWPFVRGIHRWPVNSPHKGQWRGALMLSLICAWINGWVNTRDAVDFRHHRARYDVIVLPRSACVIMLIDNALWSYRR